MGTIGLRKIKINSASTVTCQLRADLKEVVVAAAIHGLEPVHEWRVRLQLRVQMMVLGQRHGRLRRTRTTRALATCLAQVIALSDDISLFGYSSTFFLMLSIEYP